MGAQSGPSGRTFLVAMVLLAAGGIPAGAQQNLSGILPVAGVKEPFLFLIRDPVVLRDLELTEAQADQLQRLNDELDPLLWPIRAQKPADAEKTLAELTRQVQPRVAKILEYAQQKRLEHITRRVIGMESLLREDVASKLSLTADQTNKIERALAESQRMQEKLRQQAREGGDVEELLRKAAVSTFELERKIAGILTRGQRARVPAYLGDPIDVWRLGRIRFRPPPFPSGSRWLDDSPLTFEQLRGKVVALIFWRFGDLACVRSYPHYRLWQQRYSGDGLVIVGVHTPSTQQEKSADAVRTAVADAGVQMPVLLDNQRACWKAWGNTVWPTVYLIDREGRVRYWWQGEVGESGGEVEKLLRQRIEELLKDV